ncbi:ferredoxin reductase [Streptomyces xanthochromogenes]|uniref:ferredoxin reductase n=1 Tax=Streptomyces xanthochromogenes TaxID=67384 RepID=UPI00344383D5
MSALNGPFARLLTFATWLTSPLTPDDYLGLIDPLLDARHPAGQVTAVRPETAHTSTLTIRPGRGWSGHQAGQYIPVGVEVDGVRHWRTYSLTSPPDRPDGLLAITVKAVPDGTVSPPLAHRTESGTVLRLGSAQGDFVLPDTLPSRLLMLTAGSGITPVMALLRALMSRRPPHPDVVLLHSTPSPGDSIFGEELRAMQRTLSWLTHIEHHTRAQGRITPEEVARHCPDWRARETFVCGPQGLLDAAENRWKRAGLGGRIHVERFRPTPLQTPGPPGPGGGLVLFTRSGVHADADASTPLLAVGEAAGVPMPYGCRRGICFGCLTPLAYGRARDLRTGELHHAGQLIQTCVTAAAAPLALQA